MLKIKGKVEIQKIGNGKYRPQSRFQLASVKKATINDCHSSFVKASSVLMKGL